MQNEIYIASQVAKKLNSLPPQSLDNATQLINSLGTDWENSQVIVSDAAFPGQGLRSVISGDLKVYFRYAPQEHAIIVADVTKLREEELLVSA